VQLDAALALLLQIVGVDLDLVRQRTVGRPAEYGQGGCG
jgi:hypothetical protein